jgi:hypothetical protein
MIKSLSLIIKYKTYQMGCEASTDAEFNEPLD